MKTSTDGNTVLPAAPESRWFTSSHGIAWRVFKVEPTFPGVAAVTQGREGGWLTFVSDRERRRLAPIPSAWTTASHAELEELCDLAVTVPTSLDTERDPLRRDVLDRRATDREQPVDAAVDAPEAPVVLPQELRDRIRDEAGFARASNHTVVQGMMSVRRLLTKVGIAVDSPEFRAARKLFLDVFYFSGS